MAKKPKNLEKRRLRSSNITVVVSIALVLFLIGITGLILINIKDYTNWLKEKYVVEVFLKDFVDKKDTAQVLQMQIQYKDELKKKPYVKSVSYISKEQAFRLAEKDLGPDKVKMIEEDIFPASIQLTIKSEFVNEAEINKIVQDLGQNTVVDEVHKDDSLMVEVYQKINQILIWLFAISILFLIIAVVLINNSIRLGIFSKRFIIKTMQLVGAKKSFIMKPFLERALILGLVGSLIAIVFLVLLWSYFTNEVDVPFNVNYNEYIYLGLIILFIGITITLLSTYFATSRFLRLKIDDLYYS